MKVKPDRILDCVGLYCPEPVYRTRMELDQMKVGEILEVEADDPAAEEDIKSLIRNLEQELLDVAKEGDVVKIQIKRIR